MSSFLCYGHNVPAGNSQVDSHGLRDRIPVVWGQDQAARRENWFSPADFLASCGAPPMGCLYVSFLQSLKGGDLAVMVEEDDFQCTSGTGVIMQVVQGISTLPVFQRLDLQDY